ncbi:hypothetical protein Tco_0740410, partial [Tanacetum coccineum]
EDHADYPADGGDDDDEPSDNDDDDDDADDEDEEPFKDEDDDEEEEEHLASVDSSAIPVVDPVLSAGDIEAFKTDESAPTHRLPQIRIPFAQKHLRRARKTVRLEPPMSPSMEAHIAEYAVAPAPPSPLSPWSPPLPQIPSPSLPPPPSSLHLPPLILTSLPLLSSPLPVSLFIPPPVDRREDIPEAELPPRKRLCLSRSGRVQQLENEEFQVRLKDAHDDRAYLRARVNTLFRDRPYHRHTTMILDREAVYACIAWTSSEDRSAAIEAHVRTLEAQKMAPRKRTARASSAKTNTPTSTPITDAQLRTLIERGVASMLAEHDADMSRNGDDSHDSGTGRRGQTSTVRECTYTDFLKCQPMNFKGTEGVVELTQWL